MSTKPNIPEEEIDLGSLFNQIGKMFSKLFKAIGKLFGALYHFFIIVLLFLRKNVIPLGIAMILGAIAGLIIDNYKTEGKYVSTMKLDLQYKNGHRLYEHVEYLDELVDIDDTLKLGDIFNISSQEAASLKKFGVNIDNFKKDSYEEYDNYIQKTDTIFTRDLKYEDYLKRLDDNDARFHTVTVVGSDPYVFQKLNDSFTGGVENDYYKDLKVKKLNDLLFEKNNIEKSITQIDTLRKRYKETAYLQFEEKEVKENSGISFRTINPGYRGNADLDLFRQSDSLLIRLKNVNELILKDESLVKVIKSFSFGIQDKSVLGIGIIKYAIIGFSLVFLFIILKRFNSYLSRYEKETNK